MKDFNDFHQDEISAIQTICTIWNCDYVFTDKEFKYQSAFDGMFIRDNTIKGVFEVKTRTQTYSWFKDYKSIIISYDKIFKGSQISSLLQCLFFVLVRTSCKKIIVFQITDNNGNVLCPMNVRYTQTQKSSTFDKGVNNKKITTNAYLMLEDNPFCFVYNEEHYENKVFEKYNKK
jgi:hypothetical protein